MVPGQGSFSDFSTRQGQSLLKGCQVYRKTSLSLLIKKHLRIEFEYCVEVRGQLWEGLSFHHVGLRDEIQVIRLGSKNLNQMNHLAVPAYSDLWISGSASITFDDFGEFFLQGYRAEKSLLLRSSSKTWAVTWRTPSSFGFTSRAG